MRRAILLLLAIAAGPLTLWAEPDLNVPVLVEKLSNPNDYTLFANSGWDGNWYVGYDTCWIVRLPAIPQGAYARAYIGVKLGRAKIENVRRKPWEMETLPGEIFAAISSTSAWKAGEDHLVTRSNNLPLEGDSENAINGVGESEWFWTPVPLKEINFSGDNYISVWSPTPAFVTVSSSPVLAAGWGGKEISSWLLHDIHGQPPRKPASLNPGISYFQPAIVLKLIPASAAKHRLSVKLLSWIPGSADHAMPVVSAWIEGDAVESAWVEAAGEKPPETWTPVSRPIWKTPFIFSLDLNRLPPEKIRLRVVAVNAWEESSESAPFNVLVSTAKH